MSHYIVEKRADNVFSILNPDREMIASVPNLDVANQICDALNVPAVAPELRGEFVRIEVDPEAQPANRPSNPFTRIHATLVTELARVVVPRITVTPMPEQFEDVADYLLRTARTFDRALRAIGSEVKSNTTSRVDMSVFEDVFEAAIDGNATHELDGIADDLRDEYQAAGLERRARKGRSFADEIVDDLQRITKTLYGA